VFVFVAEIAVPEAVSWVVVKAVNSSTLEVTWSPSNNSDYYQVACINSCLVNVSSTQTKLMIGQLVPGTEYTISVVACASLCNDRVHGTSGNDTASMDACPSLCSDGVNGTNNTCTSAFLSLSLSLCQ